MTPDINTDNLPLDEHDPDYVRLMSYFRCAMMEVETKLNVLNEEFALELARNPINSIQVRLKEYKSIVNKLRRLGVPETAASIEENLHDVAGLRVVCHFLEDVYTMADALLQQDDIRLVEIKDYIKHPKENGYRSLHLIVTIPIYLMHQKRHMKVEIQLRTMAMDFWAGLEHQLRYKKNVYFSDDMARQLLECAELSADLDKRMDDLRINLQEYRHR